MDKFLRIFKPIQRGFYVLYCKKLGTTPSLVFFILCFLFPFFSEAQEKALTDRRNFSSNQQIITGSERTRLYFPFLKDKNIAVLANQTSIIGKKHLVDSLLNAGFAIKKVFCPEHGFRGHADAGQKVEDQEDSQTGLPIISLYGKKKKPTEKDLEHIDLVIFDIQDVGARFYTYISTMHYVMEACAENNIHFLVLDRPNPNGFYVDGPVREAGYKSFVAMHPVPIVHGMTIAEYARMINNEGWLPNGIKCKLKYVPVYGYNHKTLYHLEVKPSPNLPGMDAVYLYPSLALFEGTVISVGRGTEFPFRVYGNPVLPGNGFSFIPEPNQGARYPKHEGERCYGEDLSDYSKNILEHGGKIELKWLIKAYRDYPNKGEFFNHYFDLLAGNSSLRKEIQNGVNPSKIRNSWKIALEKFKEKRKLYLLYEDFE